MKVAGAPITWGVCEAPGWGHQLSPDRVLSEMAGLGLTATELGPDGFLPSDPQALRATLEGHALDLVGAFVPVVLHVAETWPAERAEVERKLDTLAAAGATVAVLAANTRSADYESSEELTDAEWRQLALAIADIEELAAARGLTLALHPHWGTVVESPGQIERLLRESPVKLCLDTGHVLVGGGDPAQLAREQAGRIVHVHAKDADAALAARVRAGELTYHDAVAAGLYRPLGDGDVDVPAIVAALDAAGFEGWYVLEQDAVLAEEPPAGEGPVADAEASLRYLTSTVPSAAAAG